MYKKIIGVLILIGVLFLAIFSFSENQPKDIVMVDFEVKKGENIWNTASSLKKEGIIDSKIYFVWRVYKDDYRGKIKAGKYILNSNLKTDEVLMILAQGDTKEEEKSKRITFPEGFSIKQMSEYLTKNDFDGNKFLELTGNPQYFRDKYGMEFLAEIPEGKSLEGFLFPDTYFFFIGEEEEIVIKKMLENFERKLSEDLRNEIKNQNKNVYEILTMASIVEKEANNAEDGKKVSSVFWNRIKNGQALQSCATLAFVLGEYKNQYSYEDTQVDSPYNTYLNAGLPPGPITNPGLNSILAAIYPAKTDYNYFLNNPQTKETFFSVTLEEHNLNKDRNGL